MMYATNEKQGWRRGFTLIELLIVIAIILILIAIALPNFLEAQLRAKITKARADMRTMSIALETYFLDWKKYVNDHDPNSFPKGLYQLTTPIPYLAAIPEDPFTTRSGLTNRDNEYGWEVASTGHLTPLNVHAYNITSHGPDAEDNFSCNDDWPFCRLPDPCPRDGWIEYCPTNGTRSAGELTHLGGEYKSGSYCIDGWRRIRGKFI